MATEVFRKHMIALYTESRPADMYLSGKFTVKPDGISDTEKVVIDIVRNEENISPVVNTREGPTFNTADAFTTKEFTPPSINEGMALDVKELLKRNPGQTEYDAADMAFQSAMVDKMLTGMGLLEQKIRRNREWQASQILQTGVLDLVDQNGVVNYQVDYLPKATHFPTVGTAWDQAGADPISDIEALADLIRDDSLQDADRCTMGAVAFNAFIRNTIVQAHFDNRRMELGVIAPAPRGEGAKFQGFVEIGNYRFEIWTYNGRGIIPGDSAPTKFVADASCIVEASSGRIDTVFGGVPVVQNPHPMFASVLPDRISVPQGVDISPNIYSSLNGKETIMELESRPLLVPVAIDSFGNLNTGV